MSKYDLKDIKYWIFDLDNTLYPPEQDLFAKVDVRMTEFIQSRLNLSQEDAFLIQKRYWKEYGTTLSGLMQQHQLSPDDFLDFVHDIDVSQLSPDPELDLALSELNGVKYIFTNGTTQHAENVSRQLGIRHHFEDIFDIRAADYIPKPQKPAYEKMITHFGINPAEAIFFEDMARNLPPAAELGLKTVWVRPALAPDAPDHAHISHEQSDTHQFDFVIDALAPFLQKLS